MRSHLIFRTTLLPGLAYAAAAAFSIVLTRVGDGVAMFWIATAFLVPVLVAWPARRWWPTLVACWLGSVAATGLLGFGWQLSPLLATANCAEAAIAALLMRAAHRRFHSFTSLPWMGLALLSGALIAPLLSGTMATAAIAGFVGLPASEVLKDWMVSHGLGFIALSPAAGLLLQAQYRRRSILPEPGKRATSAIALSAVIVAGALCFGQSSVPMMFLPILVMMYVMILTDLTTSAIAMFLLVAMGTASAFVGTGPLRLIAAEPAERILFLQLYAACMALTSIPIAMMLEKRRKMFSALEESEARYRLLADFSTDIIMVTDNLGELRYVSPSIRQLGEFEPDDLVGKSMNSLIAEQHREEIAEAYLRVLRNPGATASVEFLGITRSNGMRWFETHMRGIFREDGSVDGVCSVVRDIAKRKRRESEMQSVSLADPLTSLANRRAFEVVMASTGKENGESYVALFDLDHLKRVNDGFGEAVGDAVIASFARAARGVLRDGDLLARLGSEEFAVHLHETTLAQARLVCERIRAALVNEVRVVAPHAGDVSASVGISLCSGPLEAVMRRAEAALREAKAKGGNRLAIAA